MWPHMNCENRSDGDKAKGSPCRQKSQPEKSDLLAALSEQMEPPAAGGPELKADRDWAAGDAGTTGGTPRYARAPSGRLTGNHDLRSPLLVAAEDYFAGERSVNILLEILGDLSPDESISPRHPKKHIPIIRPLGQPGVEARVKLEIGRQQINEAEIEPAHP